MADSDIISYLVNRWILNYGCFELYREFSDNLRVHQTWQLMFIDFLRELDHSAIYNILSIKQQDDFDSINTLLIQFMNSVSNSSKLHVDNIETLTPLEESLKYIDQLSESSLKEPAKTLLMKLRRVIRQECVVICFRCYKLKLAKAVYERVWGGINVKDLHSKNNLVNLFKEDINLSTALEPFSVLEPLEINRKFFNKYFGVYPMPFLIRNAEKMFEVHSATLQMASKKKKVASENIIPKQFLIQCWFAEYFCYLAWKNMDDLHTKKFDWVIKFVAENNLETKSCLLIRFMFKFSERKNLEDSMSSYLSPLELCLDLLSKAEALDSEDSEGSADALSTLKLELKRHAVLVWCGKNMYEKASVVFNRLFGDDDESEADSNLRISVENVLKGHDQSNLDDIQLSQFVKDYFSKVFADWEPHLLKVAASVGKIMKTTARQHACEQGPESKKRHRTSKKLPDDFVYTDTIGDDPSVKKRKDLHRSFSNFDEESARKAPRYDDSDSEGMDDRRRKSESRQRTWLDEEEELIYRGVKSYGVGNWSVIARNMLVQRSDVEVKEKWKAMMKQGKVEKYVKSIGPIPGIRYNTQINDRDF